MLFPFLMISFTKIVYSCGTFEVFVTISALAYPEM